MIQIPHLHAVQFFKERFIQRRKRPYDFRRQIGESSFIGFSQTDPVFSLAQQILGIGQVCLQIIARQLLHGYTRLPGIVQIFHQHQIVDLRPGFYAKGAQGIQRFFYIKSDPLPFGKQGLQERAGFPYL